MNTMKKIENACKTSSFICLSSYQGTWYTTQKIGCTRYKSYVWYLCIYTTGIKDTKILILFLSSFMYLYTSLWDYMSTLDIEYSERL